MKNNNRKIIQTLSVKSLKNNKMRNLFAVMAIALTCMLFTVLASMGLGMAQVTQEQTMREVGGRFHAGLKKATAEQMEKITSDSRVVDYSWNIFIARADNLIKRSAEIRYADGEKELKNSFVELEEGRMPENEDEIIADTLIMDELRVPHELGQEITLTFHFHGEEIQKTFKVCGWYQGDKVSHATQLYVSEAYWKELKGDLSDQDFQEWGYQHLEDSGQGLYSVGMYFKSANNIEEKMVSIIKDAGYEPEKDISYGINWAYMGNRMESIDIQSAVLLVAALLVVLLTGYLIIYNIFQISIINDIRFYGLLKTIGTTKRQTKRMVRRQALTLSVLGIPIGLAAGFLVSKVVFPFAMSMLDLKDMKISLHFEPAMILFGAVFALLTVLISCRKPGKIAGSVSPVEALGYSEGSVKRKKEKKSEKGARVHRMALSNLGRNKKKTTFVILSLSLSVVLLCVVLTCVSSFQLDEYLKGRMVGDIVVGTTNYTGGYQGIGDYRLDTGLTEELDRQPGIISKSEMWAPAYTCKLGMDEAALQRYQDFRKQGLLREDEFSIPTTDAAIRSGLLGTDTYAYDSELLKNIKAVKGEIDIEKFQKGGYVLISSIIGDGTDNCFLYEPGDKVKVSTVTDQSEMEEIKTENGETVGVEYTNMEEKEYEVMAIVETPTSMDEHRYEVNGVQIILPKKDLAEEPEKGYCFAVSYTLEEEHLENFTQIARNYTENVNRYMGYLTKEGLREEFSGMTGVVQTLGVALSTVIALIGIMNFVNAIFTGIVARKREFAILCSIGMTKKQLKQMLLEEGLYYVLISGGVSIILGSLLSYLILNALNQVILFFDYQYNFWAFVFMIPLFTVIAVVVPYLVYGKAAKESIVERLRDTEN